MLCYSVWLWTLSCPDLNAHFKWNSISIWECRIIIRSFRLERVSGGHLGQLAWLSRKNFTFSTSQGFLKKPLNISSWVLHTSTPEYHTAFPTMNIMLQLGEFLFLPICFSLHWHPVWHPFLKAEIGDKYAFKQPLYYWNQMPFWTPFALKPSDSILFHCTEWQHCISFTQVPLYQLLCLEWV